MCPLKRCVEILTLMPLSMILPGSKVSVDIIKLMWSHPGLEWGWLTDWCPSKRREIWTQRHTDAKGEGHMMADTETSEVWTSQATGRIPDKLQRLGKRQRTDSPSGLQKEPILLPAQFPISSLQNCERLNFCCFETPSLQECTRAALGNEHTSQEMLYFKLRMRYFFSPHTLALILPELVNRFLSCVEILFGTS